jgi:hypothetical protein
MIVGEVFLALLDSGFRLGLRVLRRARILRR